MTDRMSAGSIDGSLIRRGDAEYERARADAVWNGLKPGRFPAEIVVAATEDDVPRALARARAQDLRVSVRSGGHNWSGTQLRDDALLLDLSRLNRCVVDPGSGTAHVGPAVTGRVLASALEPHGLALPFGHCSTVALGGFLLSGGLGWNSRAWGPACSYVEEVEAVTADGSRVVCNERENPDLFWAARGAGPGFFAVATRFRLRFRPHPGAIVTTSFTFPLPETERVAAWAVPTARALPPSVETSFVLSAREPAAATPSGPAPGLTLTSTVFARSAQEGADVLAPVTGCPFADRAVTHRPPEPTSYVALHQGADGKWPGEQRYAVDTLWSPEPYETQLARAARAIAEAPSGDSLVLVPFEPVGPGPQGGGDAMAFSPLGESYLAAFAIWDDPAQDEACTRWLRRSMDAFDPRGTGSHYIAEADLAAGTSRSRRSYAPAGWERLKRLKAHWDPANLFHSYLVP
ncbi:oxidoreductase [Streptomyces daqingensis]|uniref:Oxidoreductase n=1 Tax=Streptomyces daqingensis TaxID=1472640 RepID=A0ABQ2MR94_9ACTN|nr:FAD-binding oxidoreductase [Streptomyces daqingensis]GGO57116.1 oxidoreductase [Streptomyces daqingensis]